MLKKLVNNLPSVHRYTLGAVAVFVLLLLLMPSEQVEVSKHTSSRTLLVGTQYPLEISVPISSTEQFETNSENENWQAYKVKNGDTIARIFSRLGLSAQTTYHVSTAGELAKKLVKIKPGETLYIHIDDANQLSAIRYPLNATDTLFIEASGEKQFSSKIEVEHVDTLLNFAQGTITSSFWNAGAEAGLSDNLIMRLAGIFGWDIDFAQEIREGDTFNMIFEEQYINGEFIGYGDIVAAEFVNQGDTFQTIKHSDGNFYTPDGRSMRKSFLRAPVNFKYISSNFSKSRYHPVQKRWKAHRGVDYGAKTGTPVVAAGDGKVIRAKYDQYNGHHVFIQHGEKYVTKYLHFTKRAVKYGQSVKQGQVIGYVGATGLASGPHLHYEFLVDGVHRNPRTVKLPQAKPIDKKEAAAFAIIAKQKLAQLDNNKRIMLAKR